MNTTAENNTVVGSQHAPRQDVSGLQRILVAHREHDFRLDERVLGRQQARRSSASAVCDWEVV
jgi:hypothetical protein